MSTREKQLQELGDGVDVFSSTVIQTIDDEEDGRVRIQLGKLLKGTSDQVFTSVYHLLLMCTTSALQMIPCRRHYDIVQGIWLHVS